MKRWTRTWHTMGHWMVKGEGFLADGGGHGLLLAGVAAAFYLGIARLAL